jgi:hypothetical protein
LQDSVRHAVTGWLVQPGQSLTAALIDALDELGDPRRQHLIANQARAWAAGFSWDTSAERLAGVLLAEIRHRELGSPERRQAVDLATEAWWPPDLSGELYPLLRKRLRTTDVISSDGEGLKVLLFGCDEVGAAIALQRVPIPPTGIRLATSARVMSNTVEQDLP